MVGYIYWGHHHRVTQLLKICNHRTVTYHVVFSTFKATGFLLVETVDCAMIFPTTNFTIKILS